MNIVGMVGSLRQNSYNRMVFNFYQKMIQGSSELTEGKIADFPLYNEDLRENAPPAAVTRLAEQLRQADAILFFSPEYNYSIPGPLKNAIDWVSKLTDQPFAGKPVSIVSASPGKFGGARMQYQLRQVGVFLDMRFLNRPEVTIAEVHKKVNAQGELTDEDTRKFLALHFEKFTEFVQRGSR